MGNRMNLPRRQVDTLFHRRRNRRRMRNDPTRLVGPATIPSSEEHELYLAHFLQHDPNAYSLMEGQTALHLTAVAGRLDLVRYLVLDRKVSVNCLNHAGRTPLADVVPIGREDVIDFLLQHGADPLQRHSDGSTTLHCICEKSCKPEILSMILRHMSRQDVVNKVLTKQGGLTALHCACEKGNVDTVRMLLQHGACMNILTKDARTPFMLACEGNQVNVVQFLMESCPPDAGQLTTILRHSCIHGSQDVVRYLVETCGGDPYACVSDLDSSSFHCAVEAGHLDVMYYFLREHNAIVMF